MHTAPAKTLDIAMETIDCPGCGGSAHEVVYRGDDRILHSGIEMRIVRCAGCGLHFTNPRPAQSDLGRYYPSEYAPYQHNERDGGRNRAIARLVVRYHFGSPDHRPRGIAALMAAAIGLVKPAERFGFGVPYRGQGRLLDFGCGQGKFLRRMRDVGWRVTGIDFSERAVGEVRRAGIRAHVGTLPHPELETASFDIVTMRHSLEHVPDPLPILREARRLLAPGGMLLVQVPNFASFEVARFGESSGLLDLPRHLIHFTPRTLASMLERAGYSNVRIRQACRANWMRKTAARRDCRTPRVTDPLYRSMAFCRLVSHWCKHRGRGNELIATAEPDGAAVASS